MPVLTAKDVQAKVQQALSASPIFALRDLTVERDEETLVITGRVSSFYHKQLAQEIVRQAVGHVDLEVDVINSISVL